MISKSQLVSRSCEDVLVKIESISIVRDKKDNAIWISKIQRGGWERMRSVETSSGANAHVCVWWVRLCTCTQQVKFSTKHSRIEIRTFSHLPSLMGSSPRMLYVVSYWVNLALRFGSFCRGRISQSWHCREGQFEIWHWNTADTNETSPKYVLASTFMVSTTYAYNFCMPHEPIVTTRKRSEIRKDW